ncbi:unnamed protein product [Euphydryas editha]|uniref:HAT C-terminal dimerisation domain-containing protein n=1 Tax=Euphydryas editha TaxID=104508 RepID=A0AAU9UU96_EUPED|nr:unnamed protein product [Euphydryas editha]
MQDELEMTLNSLNTSGPTQSPSCKNTLEVLIRKEMNYFESTGTKGTDLQFVYNVLMAMTPTSVEAEGAFSAVSLQSQEPFSRRHH